MSRYTQVRLRRGAIIENIWSALFRGSGAGEKMRTVSATAVGQHLDMTRQRVRMLTKEGVLHCGSDQRYELDRARIDYLRWLRAPDRRSARTETNTAIQRLRIRALELKIAKEEGQLVETSEVVSFLDELMGLLRSELSGLPARVTNDLRLRRMIDKQIFEILTRVSNRAADKARNES